MNQQRLKLKPNRKPKNFWRNLAHELERRLMLANVEIEQLRRGEAESLRRMGVRLAG